MSKFAEFFKKRRSLSVWDAIVFFTKFVLTYAICVGTLYLSTILESTTKQKLSGYQIAYIFGGGFVLVVLSYIKELGATHKKEGQLKERKIIYDCIGGAVEQLVAVQSKSPERKRSYVNELLKYVEKVVSLTLKEDGTSPGEICSNLMIKNDDHLELVCFGTFLSGRTKLALSLQDPLRPGAPEAFHYKKAMYVDNTMSEKFRKFFDEEKPYRSILSIPIIDDQDNVIAIVNIDSDIPNQFNGQDFVNKKILPTVMPLLKLLQLEKDILQGSNWGLCN